MHDSEEIDDIHEVSDSDLQSKPDDDMRSVSGFHTTDSDDTHENEVQKNLQDQLLNLLLKPMYKEFNAFNKLERANTADIVQEEQPSTQVVTNEEKALVVHNLEEMKSEGTVSIEDDLDDDELDKQSLSKRFKIITPIPTPIPLKHLWSRHLF
ncbi:hypothetical protein Tco_0638221 [Tanacetum coccineum]